MRKLKARTHEELQKALKTALAAITLNDLKTGSNTMDMHQYDFKLLYKIWEMYNA